MQEKLDKNIQISEISLRIASLIEFLGINQKEFASKINVGTGRLSNVLKGRNKPDTDFVSEIIRVFRNVNPLWLLIGEGEISILPNYPHTSSIAQSAEPTPEYKSAKKIEEFNNELVEVYRENRKLRKKIDILEGKLAHQEAESRLALVTN
jgi:transcriptional regulator with XRE-family HTH domain